MRHVAVFLLCLLGIASFASAIESREEFLRTASQRYIVVLNDKAAGEHHLRLQNKLSLATKVGHANIRRHFKIGSFAAISMEASEQLVQDLSADPAVAFVERDGVVRAAMIPEATCLTQTGATWGINRVTERQIDINGKFIYEKDQGHNVTVYVIDTGIYVEHEEFEGRAVWGSNQVSHEPGNKDGNGHGTHCAGTIGGKTYGIAREAKIVAVKVLDSGGSGTYAEVIGGVEWVANTVKKNGGPAVASMSLGGPKNKALDSAIEAAINEVGVTFTVAAGNENSDACNVSPANVGPAITVGATEVAHDTGKDSDKRAYYSNWGTCVDIFAPGSSITSAWIGSPTATRTISGTSMATPHVAGAAAVYLSQHPNAKPAEVKEVLKARATPNVINLDCHTTNCGKSPNILLYIPCGEETTQNVDRPVRIQN